MPPLFKHRKQVSTPTAALFARPLLTVLISRIMPDYGQPAGSACRKLAFTSSNYAPDPGNQLTEKEGAGWSVPRLMKRCVLHSPECARCLT